MMGEGGLDLGFAPLFAGGSEAAYAAGETIFTFGSAARRVYLILRGRVRISRLSPDGRELTLAVIGPGEILGEVALLDGGERTAEAAAQTEVRLIGLTRAQFHAAIAAHPENALRVIAALCQRLREADRLAEEMTFYGVKERLNSLIGRLTEKKQDTLLAKLTHQEIAEMIGTSRESVTRAMAELRKERI